MWKLQFPVKHSLFFVLLFFLGRYVGRIGWHRECQEEQLLRRKQVQEAAEELRQRKLSQDNHINRYSASFESSFYYIDHT